MSHEDQDKMIVQMSFKCSSDLEDMVKSLASSADITPSMFIRNAIMAEAQRQKKIHDSLSKVFGNGSKAIID